MFSTLVSQPDTPAAADAAQVRVEAETVVARAFPLHQAHEAVVGVLVVKSQRTQRRVDSVQGARGRRVQRAEAAGAAAEALVVGERRGDVGHADADFVETADTGSAARRKTRMSSVPCLPFYQIVPPTKSPAAGRKGR